MQIGIRMKNKKIAEVLKRHRKKNNYKVTDVAAYLKAREVRAAAAKTIYGWESGQTQPDADTLMLLCEFYQITDILGTFGYAPKNENLSYTAHEKEVLNAYRTHPRMREAIDKLLDVKSSDSGSKL